MDWLLTDAKNRFSELMTQALTNGPQRVYRRHQAVVILSEEEYQRLIGERPRFKDYLRQVPELADLDLTRDKSPMRDFVL